MSAFKGTPGPWTVGSEDADSGEIEVISEARPYVCMVLPGGIDDTTAANARLIAAAPELLEVAQRSADALRSAGIEPRATSDSPLEWLLHQTEAAIAKATGDQP